MRNGLELATSYYACLAAGFVAVPINNRLIPEEIEWVLDHSGARAYFSQPDLQVRPDGILQAKGERVAVPKATDLNDPDDRPALLLYTSGTTAHPKGVSHSQRTLAGNVSYMKAWGLTSDDHTLLFTPMVHASGAIMHLISSLSMGASVTIIPVFDAATVLDAWERNGTTFYMTLPTLLRALVAEQRIRPRRVYTARLAICGGDAVPVPLQEEYAALFGQPMVEGYGLTEGLPLLANHPRANRPGSMGRPVGDVETRVVEGDLWVRGGSNISPQEVEETLYQHPAVAEAGVIGQPDPWWGEVVLACVTLREGQLVSEEELLKFSRRHLAEYKCPARVIFLEGLPKGATGKVQRRALKELLAHAVSA
jgi:long-chain acyl-CoA synthetase